jgi:hypothetical protein
MTVGPCRWCVAHFRATSRITSYTFLHVSADVTLSSEQPAADHLCAACRVCTPPQLPINKSHVKELAKAGQLDEVLRLYGA